MAAEPASGRRVFLAASGGKRTRRSAHPENGRGVLRDSLLQLDCARSGVRTRRSAHPENRTGGARFSTCG
ncbi:MAG: hypothetical protein OXG81_00565 [Acidobacteria bacterium]|nr:hypothetical protein [Acidobacteriota bacterium]